LSWPPRNAKSPRELGAPPIGFDDWKAFDRAHKWKRKFEEAALAASSKRAKASDSLVGTVTYATNCELSDHRNAPDVGGDMVETFNGTLYQLLYGSSKDEALRALNSMAEICLHEARLRPGKSRIDCSTVYSTFTTLLKKWDAKRCSCCQQVFATDAFRQFNRTLFHECKNCKDNKEAHDRAREWSRREQERLTDARWSRAEVQNAGKTEDEFVQWVVPLLRTFGLIVRVMEEFRRTDVLVRRPGWKPDKWVRIQVKTDSGFERDGTTLKSVDAKIQFNHCFGYGAGESDAENAEHRMLMLCGALRRSSREDPVSYKLWCVDGTLVKKSKTLTAFPSVGTLSPLTKHATTADEQPCSIKEVVARIDHAHANSSFPTTTLDAAFVDKDQRKEMILMLCLQQKIDEHLSYPSGFQSSIDCTFRDKPTQCKTYDVAGAAAGCSHRFRGVDEEPYDFRDGIELLVEFFLVRQDKTNTFHLFYAQQTVDDLVANEVFTDVDNGKKHYSTCIRPHLPAKYQEWVFGKTRETKIAWLKRAENEFKHAGQVTPDHRLSLAMLHEVAHTSPLSTECPV
jgi:hypothetical protein